MFKDATGRHVSVDVQCDHDVIVHSWGRWDVGACSVHHDLPLLTALFLPVSPPPPSSTVAQMTTQELLLCEYRQPVGLIRRSASTSDSVCLFRKSNSNANHKDKNVRHRNSN